MLHVWKFFDFREVGLTPVFTEPAHVFAHFYFLYSMDRVFGKKCFVCLLLQKPT